MDSAFASALEAIVGSAFVRRDVESRVTYGTDALKRPSPADIVVLPAGRDEVAAVARACHEARVPLVVRGAGTGYTGGAVPTHGGVLLSLERLDRIVEIDGVNLLAVVEPHVVTARLQREVEAVGLFYPPDPASLEQSTIGGNIAECAGGPRGFKYGTTKRYVLGLEAVLATGEIIRTGSKAVKNVVGYDLTQLLVGSEGTLAIVTQATLRLVPKPVDRRTLRADFLDVPAAVRGVTGLLASGVIPATLELIDQECLHAVATFTGARMAPEHVRAVLILEVDGSSEAVAADSHAVTAACLGAGAIAVQRAMDEPEREELWKLRRLLSPSLRAIAPVKINHDVVVPRGRIPELFDVVAGLARDLRLRIPCFGHAGDGNIHVNIMLDPEDADEMRRGKDAERRLFEAVVALEGSISGEHGIGFSKAPFLPLELAPETIALMQRVKEAFDPHGILNPGKIFP